MSVKPSVLFVCVKNAGKSQVAAGLMRKLAGNAVAVHSAGTRPGDALNALSAESLAEVGVDTSDEHPKRIDPDLLRHVDRVIVLGREARVDAPDGVEVETWIADEPSERGIDGIERMRLVRDDIARHVERLLGELQMTGAVACSLDGNQYRDRADQWREALAGGVRSPVPGGVTVALPADRAPELTTLILAEQTCCGFLDFALRFDGATVVMTLTAPDRAAQVVADLTGSLQ